MGCALCYSVCPSGAIRMERKPVPHWVGHLLPSRAQYRATTNARRAAGGQSNFFSFEPLSAVSTPLSIAHADFSGWALPNTSQLPLLAYEQSARIETLRVPRRGGTQKRPRPA